ncbi:MAG: outer membrane beta-barrel family protein, partial [Gramella sp.]|nr:outer membrane beta-barrel family protein [Christiangramia sp.]
TALEILERSPGVVVNRQNNSISIAGKEGVVIMINNKISYVPVSSIVQMLEGMTADNIISIELITTPPAKLDAEGNAGYINIILKERTDVGFNGSFSLAAGYSNDFVTNNAVNFNFRKDRLNLFGNLSHALDETDQVFRISREYTDDGDQINNSTFSDRDTRRLTYNARTGLDYQITSKTIMGVLITAFSNRWSMTAENENSIFINQSSASFIDLVSDELNHWKHIGVNYNLSHEFSENSIIDLDLDYLYYKDNNPNDYLNSYFDENRNFVGDTLVRSTKQTPIKTYVAALDYKSTAEDKLKIETGLKITISSFENEVAVEEFVENTWIPDPTLTNKSFLDENIYAGYFSTEYSFTEKTGAKIGLRYEYTDSKLDTDTEGRVVDRKYGELFPTIFFNHTINDTLSMNISYSRRIRRPTFNNLAPFVLLLDPNTFVSGNASLQPAISNAVRFSLNYRSVVASIEYTNEESTIANFQERLDEETGRLIFEASNLEYTRTFGISLGFPWKVYSWWRMQNNFNFVHQSVKGLYFEDPIELSLANYSFNISNSFKISESWSGELSGFYRSKGFFGTAQYDGVYRVDSGFSIRLGEKKGTLKLSVRDFFDSFDFSGGTDIPEQNLKTRNFFDFSARTILLTYTRNFGNKKLELLRNRETGAEEERQRVTEQ